MRRRRATALAMLLAVLVVAAVAIGAAGGGRARHSGAPGAAGQRAADAAHRSQRPPGSGTPAASTSTTTTTTTTTTTVHRPPPTAYRVGLASMVITEPSVPAIATGHTAAGVPVRTLPTVVRYPAVGNPSDPPVLGAAPDRRAGPFPLVVFSQGFDISAEAYSVLLDAWARAGFVVADPTYPDTDPAGPEGINESDIVNHPADLRFVISTLLGAGHNSGSVLNGLIAPRVALIGHSDGGDVTLAVAAGSCCHVPSVKAAVILSGAELAAFGGTYYTAGSVPLLVVQGSADTINVPGCSAQLYDGAPQPKYYLNVAGAGHHRPYLKPGPMRDGVARAVVAFLDAYLKNDPGRLRAVVKGHGLAGGESITSAPALPPGTSTVCPGAP